jgi:hypothetical protein
VHAASAHAKTIAPALQTKLLQRRRNSLVMYLSFHCYFHTHAVAGVYQDGIVGGCRWVGLVVCSATNARFIQSVLGPHLTRQGF